MGNMIEENNRSEYPASRIVLDIFDLLQDMMAIGFCHTTYWRSDCGGQPLLTIDLWKSENENNTYGFAGLNPKGDHPLAVFPILDGAGKGRAYYDETETESLHRLYDSLWDIYQKRKSETAIPDVCPF